MRKSPNKLIVSLLFLVGLILLLLWMQGVFHARVGPQAVPIKSTPIQGQLYIVSLKKVWDWQEAPGLVASQKQPQVAAQTMGRVLEVRVAPGDQVKSGQVLAVLDDAELRSRLGQAQDHLTSLQAQYHQAETDYHRFQNLLDRKVVPVREFDQVRARYETLQAQVQQARQAVNEARAYFRYGKIVSPGNGVVAEKMVDVGDLASPGKPLFTIFDPRQMRLEAQVGEQFGPVVQPGRLARIAIPSLNLELDTAIDEIVAQAASSSRTFLVKASLPWRSDLRPGMFGRLYFHGQERQALLVPSSAVNHIGQLETIQVAAPDGIDVRHIKTGKRYGPDVEVLSGLQAGEKIILPPGQTS